MKRGRGGLRSCLEEAPGWGNRAGVRYLGPERTRYNTADIRGSCGLCQVPHPFTWLFLASRAYENTDCRERRLGCSSDSLPVES